MIAPINLSVLFVLYFNVNYSKKLKLEEMTAKQTADKELNILLLGETGVGKSTWINAIANYLTYPTMKEAEAGELICPIATSFAISDKNYDFKTVNIGSDDNEVHETGESSTQQPKTYVFKACSGLAVRIIDTPGIGDTRGIEKDKDNFQSIMSHIANFEKLHAICILLKPNDARLTVMFRFCIKELLVNLHVEACKNIVFCFTQCRGTSFRPGDTLPSLQKLMSQNASVHIQLNKETIYCLDNEAVRYLTSVKSGIEMDEGERQLNSHSWNTSVRESERLIRHIISVKPHIVQNTVSLNNARQAITALIKPLSEISKIIQKNIEAIEEKQSELSAPANKILNLSEKMYFPQIDIRLVLLPHSCVVCTSADCTEKVTEGNVTRTQYTYCPSVKKTAFGKVLSLFGKNPDCDECGCKWSVHTKIYYLIEEVETMVTDFDITIQIVKELGQMEAIAAVMTELEKRLKELGDGKQQIIETSANFTCFLKKNAITLFNDALDEYLTYQIDLEKYENPPNRNTIEGLVQMKEKYEAEVKILTDKEAKDVHSITPDEVMELIAQLYTIKHVGPMLEGVMKMAKAADSAMVRANEIVYEPKTVNKSGWQNFLELATSAVNFLERKASAVGVITSQMDRL